MAVIKRILRQSKTEKIIVLALLALASSATIVISTTQIAVLLNQLYQELADLKEPLYGTMVAFVIAYSLRSIFKLVRNHITAYMGNHLVNGIRELSVSSIIQAHGRGTDMTKQYTILTYDLNAIAEILSWRTFVFLEDLMILLFAIWKTWGYHPTIAVFLMVTLMLICFLSFYLGKCLNPNIIALKNHIARISGFMRENLFHQKTVRAFHVEKMQLKQFKELCKRNEETLMELQKMNQRWIPLMDVLAQSALFLSLGMGVFFLIKRNGTMGFLALLNGYLFLLTNVAADMGNLIYFFMESRESIRRVGGIAPTSSEEEKKNVDLGRPRSLKAEWEELRINEQLLLTAGTAVFPKDTITVIKGETGAGKTVFADQLAGLGEEVSFQLYWNGQIIPRDWKESYWKKIGYDPQKACFFHESILENIYLWSEEGRGNFEQLVSNSCLEFVSELKGGFNTFINSDCNFLSGGEKQRICLARALAKEPEVLIIDDGLQAIDRENKQRILEYLDCLKRGRIIIIISADEDVSEYADRIYIMKNKKITQIKGGRGA